MKTTKKPLSSHFEKDDYVEFGPYRLTRDLTLHFPDKLKVQLPERLAYVLCRLVKKNGAAVSRQELLEGYWTDVTLGDDNLTRAVADLRKIFRDHGGECIETVYGFGYRLNTGESIHENRETASFCEEAWYRVYQRQPASLDSAVNLFNRALETDETYLPALLGLAEARIHSMQAGYTTSMESAPLAREAISRALDLEPTCDYALALKGLLLNWVDWDFAGAEQVLAKARELEPNAYAPNQATAWHLLAQGKFESAEHHFKLASSAKHLSMTARAGRAFACMYMGDKRTALNVARQMVSDDSHGAVSLGLSAIFEAALGFPAKAVSIANQSLTLMPESPVAGAILAYALARQGLAEKARSLLESQLVSGCAIGSNTMAVHAWLELGEPGLALASLESGFTTRCTWLLTMLNDPGIEALNCGPLKAAVFKRSIPGRYQRVEVY